MDSPNTVVYCAGSQEFIVSVCMPVFSFADENSVPVDDGDTKTSMCAR